MNHGIYRLVFNDDCNTWVAVAEIVRGRGKKSVRSTRRRVAAVVLGLATAAAGSGSALAAPPAATQLPVPSSGVRPFVFAGTVTGGQPSTVGNAMTINTQSRTLGLNWKSFDIGSSASVKFEQPDSTSRVLNRIWDNNPSQIMGKLSANGQIYLINQNGILFGAGSQVNVGGLVASALNLSDSMMNKLMNNGLPTTKGDSLEFVYDGAFKDFANGTVVVDAGAAIRTSSGGRVVLIAPKTVENKGLIESGDGTAAEAILAAGGKVILTAPDDPNLRGLLVETKSFTGKDDLGNNVALDGSVTNSGTINLNDIRNTGGIVSLAALAVNQKGIVKASKAVNLNGTTMLVSGSTVTDKVTINQRGSVAQIDWVSGFNVGANDGNDPAKSGNTFKSVEFVQSSTGDVAYNYINDSDHKALNDSTVVLNQAGRSTIDGSLTANGQLVLINEKGFDFNAKARVSSNNFVASALGMNPTIVNSGLLGQLAVGKRAFYLNTTPVTYDDTDPNKQQVFETALAAFRQATVKVNTGAQIESGKDGYVILAGSKIEQGGSIITGKTIGKDGKTTYSGGQVVLAAGADLYLKPAYSSALRGFTAEVNPLYAVRTRKFDDAGDPVDDTNKPWLALSRGVDANAVKNTGEVYAPLGDITLVGHEITQEGKLYASTSNTANGSIHFIARDQLNTKGEGEPEVAATFSRKFDAQGIVASDGNTASGEANEVSSFVAGSQGGTLTLADGSQTIIAVGSSLKKQDKDDNGKYVVASQALDIVEAPGDGKTLSASQAFVKSSVEAVARKIVINKALVEAKGGNIRLRARETFDEHSLFAVDNYTISQTKPDSNSTTPAVGVGIYIGDGARIDASGANAIDNTLPDGTGIDNSKTVNDLFIKVELRGDQFADNPVQRWGRLRGATAYVDIRDKVSIANLDGDLKLVGETVFEKAATGGKISLGTTGSVIVKSGAELDVSGGRVDYKSGKVSESFAVSAAGQRYRLNDAPVSTLYSGLITSSRKEAAYTEGKSAGTVEMIGHSLAVDGRMTAKTTVGTRQREKANPQSNRYAIPYGGELIIKDAGEHFSLDNVATASEEEKKAAYMLAQIVFVKEAAKAAAGLSENSSAGPRLELSQSLADNGFSRFNIASDGRIDVPADVSLNLAPGGAFVASGRQIYVAGKISAPSGTINLSTRGILNPSDSTLTLASSAALSTAGRWINDFIDGQLSTTAKAINGGDISLTSAYDLDLKSGSLIDVSGGGRVDLKKKLTSGNAGSITLATDGAENTKDGSGGFNFTEDGDRRDATLFLDGTLAGYALGKGGTLNVRTSKISFGDTFKQDSRTWSREDRISKNQTGAAFDAGIVDRGGFFNFSFVGRDGVSVADKVRLSPDPVSWSLARISNYYTHATGSALSDFAQSVVLHPELRSAPTSLALATRSNVYGDLLIGNGAYVGVSPQGSLDLMSMNQMTLLGTLEAPSGKISLRRPASSTYDEVIGDKSIFYNKNRTAYTSAEQSRSIYLGKDSQLLAGGTTKLSATTRQALESGITVGTLSGQSRYKGSVLDGGTVSIDAGLGYLVALNGSLIDVSGTTDTLNIATGSTGGYVLDKVGSAGGTVSLSAREGMFLDGTFKAAGGEKALGGNFSLAFSGNGKSWGSDGLDEYAKTARKLTLYQSPVVEGLTDHTELWPSTIDKDYRDGKAVIDPAEYNGKTSLDLALLKDGGFGSWYLTSQNEIQFSGTINATVNNQLQLNAPIFSAVDSTTNVKLTAAAAQIGNSAYVGKDSQTGQLILPSVKAGNAKVTISALDIGLQGIFSWNGFGESNFKSKGEIHFDSTSNAAEHRIGGRSYNGLMLTTGAIEFSAARLSPSTYSDFRVDLLSNPNGGSIAIKQLQDAKADVSLSVGGRLEFSANIITHDGTVAAPLGEIVFSAPGGTVTLGAGSKTSVAADRELLFGQTSGSQSEWNYQGTKIETMPTKAVRIDADDTKVVEGAQIDLSGGGDALAWEFTTGPGGKSDILAADSGKFAIVPGWNGFSATDSALQQGYLNTTDGGIPNLKAGDRISLGDNPALSGNYVLLPARYAVLPGAWLVTVKSSGSALSKALPQADGSLLVSGSRLAVNADGTTTAYSATPLTIELASHDVVAQRAEYITTTASSFFYDKAGAVLAGDAGRLTAIGRKTLSFDPSVTAMRAAEIRAADGRTRAGRGFELDLAAPKILVSDSGGTTESGWTHIDQNKLNGYGAYSLLIGGARTMSGATTKIETIATDVKIGNNNNALSAPEQMLAATDTLTVTSGSHIDTSGNAEARDIELSGDGAFLRAAEGKQSSINRIGSGKLKGDLIIEANADVAGQSLILDATQTNTLDGSVSIGTRQKDGSRPDGGSGGAIEIGAGRINIVGDGSTPTKGMILRNADLERFAKAEQIALTSYSTLDIYGNATMGADTLKSLSISADGIAGHGEAANVATIAAQSVVFKNKNFASASFTAGSPLGGGKLNVDAKTIEFGVSADADSRQKQKTGFAIRGFNEVNLEATGDVRFSGTGVTAIDTAVSADGTIQDAALNILANRVVTVGTADHLLNVSGKTMVGRHEKADNSLTDTGLGGRLELSAKSLEVSGKISAAAGTLTLTGAEEVKILKNAFVTAEGTKVAFDDTYAYAPGGSITLKSDSGNVTVDKDAVVSVSADPAGGDAGTLSLEAKNGTVTVAAKTLRGSASDDAVQGTLKVDANTIDLDELADASSYGTKTNFGGKWDIRSRKGELSLTKTIMSQNVSLAADNGGITIADTGKVDASGAQGGQIALHSNNGDIKLKGDLVATGQEVVTKTSNAGTRGQGGTVTLSARGTKNGLAAKVITTSTSEIDVGVATDSLATGGKVNFRAAESASIINDSDLNIQLAGTIKGASDVGVEIFSNFTGDSLKAGTTAVANGKTAIGLNSIKDVLTAKYSADNIKDLRKHLFGGSTSSVYHVRPGVEIASTSTDDFVIDNDLDFGALRFQGEAGVLTLLAKGNLKINNSISDGFVQAKPNNAAYAATGRDAKISSSDASWSYRLVAGADTTAAKLTAVEPLGATGNLEIASGKLVRTGTGDITLAAQSNITLKDRAVVYTAGRDDTNLIANFTQAPGKDTDDKGERAHYVYKGGNLSVTAGGDISQVKTGAISDWLVKNSKGINNDGTQWWARIASFQQGFAAFGEGNIDFSSGGDMTNLTIVIPTNGRVPGINGAAQPELAVIQGGGNISVESKGSINGGLFYVETGDMTLKAGKKISSNSALALGDSSVRVTTTESADIGNIFNPMMVDGVIKNTSGSEMTGQFAGTDKRQFSTYSNASEVRITSLNGDVNINSSTTPGSAIAPSRVSVAALNGSIGITMLQMPGTSGQLDVLAAKDINVHTLTQYDIPQSRIPSMATPVKSDTFAALFGESLIPAFRHESRLWHLDDTEPSRLISLTGSISGDAGSQPKAVFNEAVNIRAAGNIENLNLDIQHAHESDVSHIVANGDIRYDLFAPTTTPVKVAPLGIRVGGPGRVELAAGGDIDLANTWGIITRGNLDNPFLPEGGASIVASAGAKPDYISLNQYLQGGSLAKYLKALNVNDLAGKSEPELRDIFFMLLREIGREALETGNKSLYAKGNELAKAFFPDTTGSGNDIMLSFSQIKTEQDGDIQLLAPTGSVIVGVAKPTLEKDPAQQGIFTISGGNISAFVENNFLVNQSRVFTLDGGNIMGWSNHGDIEAGRGAKTVVATPPPVLVIRDGQIVVDTSNSVTGSGIGVLSSRDDTPASDMDLFAPFGTIDAGDAGLRSTGNIRLGAATILNSSNIQAAGSVSGAPAPVAAAAPVAAMATPTTTDNKAMEDAPTAAGKREAALGILTVEVIDGVESKSGAQPERKCDEKNKDCDPV